MVRRSLFHGHLYKFGASSISLDEEQDDFTPLEDEVVVIDVGMQGSQPSLSQLMLPEHHLRTKRLTLPIRHDLNWVLNYASTDISSYSTFLNSRGSFRCGPIHMATPSIAQNKGSPRPISLPRPYYSPHLRIGINAISRSLR
jgi:hypothetical protein